MLAGAVLAGCGGPNEPTENREGELSGTLEVIAVDGPGAQGGMRYFLRRHDPGPLMGFDPDDRSVAEYYDETSYGAYEMDGAVIGSGAGECGSGQRPS